LKENKISNILRCTVFNDLLLKCFFIAATLGTASPFIHIVVAPFMKVLLAWGIILLGYKICTNWRMYLNKYYILLAAFCVSYGITILLNRGMNFSANMKALAYMVVIFGVIFCLDFHKSKEQMIREMKVMTLVFVGVSFLLAAASLYTYVFSVKGHAMYNGQWVYYGMFENRLWGLYNPNTGSAINTLTILLISGYWIFFRPKRKVMKAFFVINVLCHYFCLLLTNSRTALYTLIIGVGMLIFLSGQYYWHGERLKVSILLKQAVFALLGCVIVFVSVEPVRAGLSYVPSAVKYVKVNVLGDEGSGKIEKEELERLEEEEERPGGIFTGRTVLWKAGIDTFKEAPVFGVSRENIFERVDRNLHDKYWEKDLERGGLHNIYLTVLVSSGIVGFVIFIAFIIIYAVKAIRYAFSQKARKENGFVLCLLAISAVQLMMEFLEARILYQVGIFYIIFWCIAGYALYFIDKPEESKNNEH